MSLPTAIASGAGADTPSAVSPLRAGLGIGVIAGLLLFAIGVTSPVPGQVLALFGGSGDGLSRYGGLRMEWIPPPDADETALALALERRTTVATVVRRLGDRYLIEVPRVAPDEIAETARRIAGEGRLTFHTVVETVEMIQLGSLLGLGGQGASPIDLDIDQWRPEGGGAPHIDSYLRGATREDVLAALDRAAALGWRLPPNTEIALEYNEGWADVAPFWRSYVIERQPALDGRRIASAIQSYDPDTNRPIVLLDFDEEGTVAFGELTARIVGHKLATVIGGQVRSAPIINGPIRGGRASITMGGSDPAVQEREARMLVTVLSLGALPGGGEVRSASWVAPTHGALTMWLARLVIALGGGALVGLLGWAIVRATRPVRRRPQARLPGAVPWTRLAVTLVAPLAILLLSYAPVAGIEFGMLEDVAGTGARGLVNLGVLGVAPLIMAFVVTEVIAVLVPGWRRRRHAGRVARQPIANALIVLAVVFTLLQGWALALYLGSIDGVLAQGILPRVLLIGSLAFGTLLLGALAAVIRRFGLGNGFGVLIASAWLVAVGRALPLADERLVIELAVGALGCLAIAVPIVCLLRWRIANVGELPLRVPTSGVAPIGDSVGILALVLLLGSLSLTTVMIELEQGAGWLREHRSALVILIVVSTLVWSAAFTRNRELGRFATRAGLRPPSVGSWATATGLSAAVLVFGFGVQASTQALPGAAWLTDPVSVALLAAVVLDAIDDLRGRRGALVLVWSLHQPQHADVVERALSGASIPLHLTSANLRTLLAFFGPFAPIDVWVPREHAAAAEATIAGLLAPASDAPAAGPAAPSAGSSAASSASAPGSDAPAESPSTSSDAPATPA